MRKFNENEEVKISTNYSLIGTRELFYKRGENESHYPLKKVTPNQLLKIRASGRSGFVLKLGNDFYFAFVPPKTQLTLVLREFGEHLCGSCERCRATLDKYGGCVKVRNHSLDAESREKENFLDVLKASKRIEKYSFIPFGFEVFNVPTETLSVFECENFKHVSRRECMEPSKLRNLQRSIEEFYI